MNVRNTAIAHRRDPEFFPGTWAFVAGALFVVTTLSLFGDSPDWSNYDSIFDILRIAGLEGEDADRIEIGFKLLSVWLLGLGLSNIGVYGVIASVSIFVKCAAINAFARSRPAYLLAVLFYLFVFASLHELTQVRAALAIAFLYFGYVCVVTDRYWLSLLLTAAAMAFHISAAVITPLFFFVYLCEQKLLLLTRNRAIALGGAVFAVSAGAVAFLIAYFEDELPIIAAYQELGFGEGPTNPLAPHIILNLVMTFFGIFLWNRISQVMRYVLVFQLTGIGFFYATLDFQVIANRIYDLIQAFWVFYVVQGLDSRDGTVLLFTQIFVLVAVVMYSYIYFFSGGFFL